MRMATFWILLKTIKHGCDLGNPQHKNSYQYQPYQPYPYPQPQPQPQPQQPKDIVIEENGRVTFGGDDIPPFLRKLKK